MKFGFFGGSFNPVHRAHIALARAACGELKLDRVYFVPAGRPPHKSPGSLAPAADRLAMLRLALGRKRRFRIDLWEFRRKRVTYAYQTLRALRRRSPQAAWHLIIGGDSLKNWRRWRRWRALLAEGNVVVGLRRGVGVRSVPPSILSRVALLKACLPRISSSEIRSRLHLGEPVEKMLPPPVARYIRRKGLYGS